MQRQLDELLRQTPFNYTSKEGKKLHLTETENRNMLLIDADDFRTVLDSEAVQQQAVQFKRGSVNWSEQKLKTSMQPFHCSSTTTDDSKILPQFKDLTHDEKLLMPSMGVEWWCELLQSEGYKQFFNIEGDAVCHYHAGELVKSAAVRDYNTVCNRKQTTAAAAAAAAAPPRAAAAAVST
jgi:hypothetical protein